ncbi:MAG: hypothetical protein QOE92_540 [Chloroflexota bacterium]|jgi:hypothetical protein|nr:hypothetical protein [Chloroflexota bacterium]
MQHTSSGAEVASEAARESRLLNPYIAVVAAAGLGAAVVSPFYVAPQMVVPLEAACIAAAAAEAFRVTLGTRTITVSASLGIILAAMVAVGPAGAIITALAGALGAGFFPRIRPLRKTAFNCGLYAVSAAAAGGASYGIDALLSGLPVVGRELLQAQLGLIVYVAVNWALLTLVLWLSVRRRPAQTWRQDLRWLVVPLELAGALGALVGMNYVHFGWIGAVLCLIPLVAVRRTLRLEATSHAVDPVPAVVGPG